MGLVNATEWKQAEKSAGIKHGNKTLITNRINASIEIHKVVYQRGMGGGGGGVVSDNIQLGCWIVG